MGTPKRCVLPTTTSAPIIPGLFMSNKAIKSEANTERTSCSAMEDINSVISSASPLASGYWTKHPYTPPVSRTTSMSRRGNTTMSMSRCAARVRKTLNVCGNTSWSTKNLVRPSFTWALGLAAKSMAMASAALVPSSKRDALATSIPVRSNTMVWKLSNASRRPWAISAWYGV